SEIETLSTTNAAGTAAIRLTGNEFAQKIFGNAGNNVINGKGGADTLYGYGGKDVFVFNTPLGAGNIDRIADFSVVDDTLQLQNAIFTALTATGTLAAAAFHTGAAAHDASDRIIYNSGTGVLLYDADGTGVGAARQFATLATGLALASADFVVI
ncbi:MAG: calcium-binding protein, partial [Bradyrhizobium sp.]